MKLAAFRIILILAFLSLIFAEVFRVYLVMPYPGSQRIDSVNMAHWISTNIIWIRIACFAIIIVGIVKVFNSGRRFGKIIFALALVGYFIVFLLFNYRLDAENIFHQPSANASSPVAENTEINRLVIGIVVNGEAKAYPIQLIGYHHQVVDTVGNEPVIITYCTVCRTGRVYSTLVNGQHESFRLVGMDHFNAVFEDNATKTWWQQATGLAIAGPLKGSRLKEIPSTQMNISSWKQQYPNSKIMDPDPLYNDRYFRLEDYDRGTMNSALVKRDYRPWQEKSWIIGVKNQYTAMAYDWNDLVKMRVIQDSLQDLPIVLALESDTTSFHVFDRRLNGTVLQFNSTVTDNLLTDRNTNSNWNMHGMCISGPLEGQQLTRVQAYNEFWHSWQTFQINPQKWINKEQ